MFPELVLSGFLGLLPLCKEPELQRTQIPYYQAASLRCWLVCFRFDFGNFGNLIDTVCNDVVTPSHILQVLFISSGLSGTGAS